MESNNKIQEYIDQMKELYKYFLSYLENSDDKAFDELIDFIHTKKYEKNKEELKNLLQLILNVSNNHQRTTNFYEKIEKILQIFESDIKQSFSNSDIFTIFKSNKRILLFLFEKDIITLDENIFGMMNDDHCQFFYPEIRKLIGKKDSRFFLEELLSENSDIFDNFDENRYEGENNSYICTLIRQDMIKEFIIHINQTNIHLNSEINPSVFETNIFLIENKPTLIEYAAFFGSIQIVRYLAMNNVELRPSLWLYAIHGNNPEIIHLIEEYQIKPPIFSYENCFIESIKCHHNDLANYFDQNYMNLNDNTEMSDDIISSIFHYHNYLYFPLNNLNDNVFFYLCFYNYSTIVDQVNFSPSTMTIEDAVKEKKIKDIYYFLSKQEKISQKMIPENNLTKIAIPPSILTIESNSFNHFTFLQKISIPSSVTFIGDNAFDSCNNMKDIIIPSSVTYIGEEAFKNCNSLVKITIPSSVKNVESSAFSLCSLLAEVELSNSMTSIESYTFSKCRSLKKITLPSSITQIKTSAFEDCVKLQNIRLPSSLKEIGNYAFDGCKSLTQISIPSSVTIIESYLFNYCISLKEISLPYSIKYIKIFAFKNCSALKDIFIPSSVIFIGGSAFKSCTSLESISIPSSVKLIDEETFYDCKSLKEVEIPSSITSIHKSAFWYCSSLVEIKVHSDQSNVKKLIFPSGVKVTYI